jgi:hypothetical protein
MNESALPGMSVIALKEASTLVRHHLDHLVDELGERFPSLTRQRALEIIFTNVIGVAEKTGGSYGQPLHAMLEMIRNERDKMG